MRKFFSFAAIVFAFRPPHPHHFSMLHASKHFFFFVAVFVPAKAFCTQSGSTRAMKLCESAQDIDAMKSSNDNALDGLKAVIFDIDGTLADSWKLGFDATKSVLSRNSIDQITEQDYHECTRYCTPDRLARHAGLDPSDEDFHVVGNRLADEFDNLYINLVSKDTAGFFPGVRELILQDLPTELPIGALTNACARYAHAVLEVNLSKDKDSKFLSIRGADDVPAPKPSPDGLLLVCKELEVSPAECVYVGDSPSDAVAAKNAGMPAIAVLWGSHSEESLRNAPFDHFCSTIEELKLLLCSRKKVM